MNATRNLFLSFSGSLTVQHLARRTVANSPRTHFLAIGSRRFYSEDSKPSERKSGGESKDGASLKDESEFSKQLAVKEQEVSDLKVSVFVRDRWPSALTFPCRVGYDIFRLTLSTYSVILRGKRSRPKTTPSQSLPLTCSRPRTYCHSLSNPFPSKRLNLRHPRPLRQHRKGNPPTRT